MAHTLFLSSTPLHTFFALGLMQGPYRDAGHTLALIDQPEGARDYIGEALQCGDGPAPDVQRYPALGRSTAPRAVLGRIAAMAAELRPTTLAVGNDHRLEFYAAVRGWPSARRTYIDDGLYSYLPRADAPPAWRAALSDWRRSIKYGVKVERPAMVGGSRAVQDAYVLLPRHVHAGLATKPVQALQPAWFATPVVAAVCARAAALAGFDASRCAALGLLLLLPHPRFLRSNAALAARIEALAQEQAAAGVPVAVKSHPQAGRLTPHEQLPGLPRAVVELPARLPVEVLAPLLSATLVVGSLTTALLSLALLGRGLRVLSLPGNGATTSRAGRQFVARAAGLYAAVGIRPIDAAAAITATTGSAA